MKLEPWTLLLQALNFGVLAWLLERWLYRPVLAVLAKRKAEAEAVANAVADERARAEATKKEVENQRASLFEEGRRLREEASSAARAEAEKLLTAARAEAEAVSQRATKRTADEAERAYEGVRDRVVDLGLDVAARALSLVSSDATLATLVDGALSRIEALPKEELDRARRSIAGDGRIRVSIHPVPATADRMKLEARLATLVGARAVELVDDASLVTGIVVHLPELAIRASFRDALDELRPKLLEEGGTRERST